MERDAQIQLLRNAVPATVQGQAWEDLASAFEPFFLPRKAIITAAGQIENYLYFVTTGAQRLVHYHPHGQEATLLFTYAPSFGGVLDSFLQQKPSLYYYETLSKSQFLRIPFKRLHEIRSRHQAVDHFMSQATVAAMAGLMQRMVDLQSLDNTEKLRALLQRSPHILQHVPHKYLANYLGMDATNFSKLHNSVAFS